jgi:DNA-binding transcriptional MerR regulator
MTGRIFTLWGEEIIPEVANTPVKARVKNEGDPTGEEKDTVAHGDEPVTPKKKTRKAKSVAGDAPAEAVARPVEEPVSKTSKEDASKLILPEGWEKDKKYYSIGEVAELFNIKTSHVRFWTNEFRINVRTTRKGDRLYTEEQIREIKAIYHLVKERGFTLTGAKAKLKDQNKRQVESVDLRTSLLQLRSQLLTIRNHM